MTELSHAELQELLGAYALDAVDGAEYDAVELHLRDCPRCRAEVAEHREMAALIGHGGAPAPDGVWDRIVAAIEPEPPRMRLHVSAVEPDPTQADVVVPIGRSRGARWNRNVLALVGVAAAIILLLGGVVIHLDNRVGTLSDQVASTRLADVAGDVRVSGDATQVDLRSKASNVIVPAALTKDGQGYLWAGATARLPDDRTYQLWGVVGQNTISLGTFPGGTQVVAFRVDSSVKALAITEEQKGGVVSSKNGAVFSATV